MIAALIRELSDEKIAARVKLSPEQIAAAARAMPDAELLAACGVDAPGNAARAGGKPAGKAKRGRPRKVPAVGEVRNTRGEVTGRTRAPSANGSGDAQAVESAIASASESVAMSDLTDATGLDRARVRRALGVLVEGGRVVSSGKGRGTSYDLASRLPGKAANGSGEAAPLF